MANAQKLEQVGQNLAQQPNPYKQDNEDIVKLTAEDIGKPVEYKPVKKAEKDNKERKRVILDNIDFVKEEIAALKAAREEDGLDCFTKPVVFFAQIVELASEPSTKKNKALRVVSMNMSGGQGHKTGILRIKDGGGLIVGHDLPTVEEYTKAFQEKTILAGEAFAEVISRFEVLHDFVEEEIEANFSASDSKQVAKRAKSTESENVALKKKIAELEAKNKAPQA